MTSPDSQAICLSRAWASRTASPESPVASSAGPGLSTLNFWSWVGVFVIATSFAHVRLSTTPVALKPRLPWNPATASFVVAS